MAYERKKDEGADKTPDQESSTKSAFMQDGVLFPLAPTPGIGLKLGDKVESNADSIKYPGIMRLGYIPTFGTVNDVTDALNLASQDVFMKICNTLRQRNLKYQKTDVMINIQALDSLHIAWAELSRVYKALIQKNKNNKYICGPKLVEALGFDYNDMSENRVDMRTQMLQWQRTLEMYKLPLIFDFVRQHQAMANYVFADTISDKAQTYLFTADWLVSREDVDEVKGLKYLRWHEPGVLKTWEDVKAVMTTLITSIINSTDFAEIASGIETTFAEMPCVEVTVPGEEEQITMYHDPAALNAIMGCTIINFTESEIAKFLPVDTGANTLMCPSFMPESPTATFSPRLAVPYKYFNSLTDHPTATEMTNYARWRTEVFIAGDAGRLQIDSWATEVLVSASIYFIDENFITHGDQTKTVTYGRLDFSSVNGFDSAGDLTTFIAAISAFKCHPLVKVFTYSISGDTFSNSIPIPITEWNFISKWPDIEPYHEALIWKSIVNE